MSSITAINSRRRKTQNSLEIHFQLIWYFQYLYMYMPRIAWIAKSKFHFLEDQMSFWYLIHICITFHFRVEFFPQFITVERSSLPDLNPAWVSTRVFSKTPPSWPSDICWWQRFPFLVKRYFYNYFSIAWYLFSFPCQIYYLVQHGYTTLIKKFMPRLESLELEALPYGCLVWYLFRLFVCLKSCKKYSNYLISNLCRKCRYFDFHCFSQYITSFLSSLYKSRSSTRLRIVFSLLVSFLFWYS